VQRPARSQPEFAAIHEQLREHRHLTLQLLWEEYRQANSDGYRYSRFCELYQRWRSKLDVVLRLEHKAGEKMFVDWAGSTIPVYDRHTRIAWQAPLFVATLGASSYTWAEATRDQQMEEWLGAHVHAFEHFGGIPALVIPDNAQNRRDASAPLRSGSESDVLHLRAALRFRRFARSSTQATR
jgi:transposase